VSSLAESGRNARKHGQDELTNNEPAGGVDPLGRTFGFEWSPAHQQFVTARLIIEAPSKLDSLFEAKAFPGERGDASERAYSGARALRSGMSEILIRPLNGSFSSKIK
jgi:hypothetical protein